jgi:hypothetical protein
MAKSRPVANIVNIVAWITGVLVSLAVGFGMAQETLTVPWLTSIGLSLITVIAGWIVVILTIIGVILAIVNKI